ncbi:MAG TPA: glucose-1-phosphate thymidylyltransferase, partial [Chitinophagaceae bacterium]
GYSNKAHDGYLGDSVIGEWCNLGANTNCSNLKNNAATVQVWNEYLQSFIPGGRKCGLLMGDYCRSGIGTMFNTGTVTGVSCNIFGGDFPPKHIPSFSWGGAAGWMKYEYDRAIKDAKDWMELKGKVMTAAEEKILGWIAGMKE